MRNFQGIFYMNTHIQEDFQICISVPLILNVFINFHQFIYFFLPGLNSPFLCNLYFRPGSYIEQK